MRPILTIVFGWSSSALITAATLAQPAGPQGGVVNVDRDSGPIRAHTRQRDVVYSTVVESVDAAWVQVVFDDVEFPEPPAGATPSVLRITSMHDGHVQTLDAAAYARTGGVSAFFNGDEVLIEMLASPRSRNGRVRIDSLIAGPPVEGGVATLCGNDDRVLSSDPRIGRLLPEGCSAWIIDDANRCFLSAGHCELNAGTIIEFNVPFSTSLGNLIHPGPEDQYYVDPASVQESDGGPGNDWGYFGCFPNTETGLTAYQTQGDYFVRSTPPLASGQTVRATGFGVDDSPSEYNQVQQTDTGPYTVFSGSMIRYVVDTRAGNSGCPIIVESTGVAIGIHTNGGCTSSGGSNLGTGFNNPNLANAIANPLGVCATPPPAVQFSFPNGLPGLLAPEGTIIRVAVSSTENGTPLPNSGSVHYNDGGGSRAISMFQVEPNVYDAIIPKIECGEAVDYFFTVDATDGSEGATPMTASSDLYSTFAAEAYDATFVDDFQNDNGWITSATGGVTDGHWARGVPVGNGDAGDPTVDSDGSGSCFVTGLGLGSDVDGGVVTLQSPTMDASAPDAHIVFSLWFSASSADLLTVQISDDDGMSWQTLHSVAGPQSTGWIDHSYQVAAIPGFTNTNQFRIQFNAVDPSADSTVEAAVDGVRLTNTEIGVLCDVCAADVAMPANGAVDVDDLVAVILAWGQSGVPEDVNGDGAVDVDDLVAVILAWGAC